MWRMGIGGAERAVYQLVREQRARGVEADVVVASASGFYGRRAREAGATVHELGCRHALDIRRSCRLTGLARRYSLVHIHSIEPLLIAAAARARTTKLVYTHRGGVRSHGVVKRLRLAAARPYLRKNFSVISGNTCQSAAVVAAYLEMPASDVPIVYNGLDFELLAPLRPRAQVMGELPPSAKASFLIGTASHLRALKRVHLLIDAIARLGDRAIHCLVLGDGPARPELERQVDVLGLPARVTFLGRKEHIGDYLQLLDVFVLPSGPEEAFGNAAVEAMGVGVPTIVFADGGGLTEHVTDRSTGLVVRDTDELAAALSELATDEILRRDLGEQGMKHVRAKYSLDAMFDRYARLYDGRACQTIGRVDA
jgi:glycosyltransferase involved in cell wall biosynthesis